MSHRRQDAPPRDTARRRAVCFLILSLAVATMGARCGPENDSQPKTQQAEPTTISRERAIEIARGRVRIDADNVEAIQDTTDGRAVWRITFKRRQPDAPPGLFETHIVEIDVRTGEIISVFMS